MSEITLYQPEAYKKHIAGYLFQKRGLSRNSVNLKSMKEFLNLLGVERISSKELGQTITWLTRDIYERLKQSVCNTISVAEWSHFLVIVSLTQLLSIIQDPLI